MGQVLPTTEILVVSWEKKRWLKRALACEIDTNLSQFGKSFLRILKSLGCLMICNLFWAYTSNFRDQGSWILPYQLVFLHDRAALRWEFACKRNQSRHQTANLWRTDGLTWNVSQSDCFKSFSRRIQTPWSPLEVTLFCDIFQLGPTTYLFCRFHSRD